jgi:hypothetical protein
MESVKRFSWKLLLLMTTIQVSCLDNPTKMKAPFSHLIKKKKKTLRLSANCKLPVASLSNYWGVVPCGRILEQMLDCLCVAQINVEGLPVDPKITIQYEIGFRGPQMMLALASRMRASRLGLLMH